MAIFYRSVVVYVGEIMRHHKVRSHVPWLIADSDVNPANDGEPEYYRDLLVNGTSERHLGLVVTGQFDDALTLGLVAIRCERRGGCLYPLTLSIPEVPLVVIQTQKPAAMSVALLSGGPRRRVWPATPDQGD